MFNNDVVNFIEIDNKGVKKVEGKYATMRLKFLQNFKENVLSSMINDDMIINHLIEIQLKAENRINEIVNFQKNKENINEDSNKYDDYITNLKMIAERRVEEELIFI